MPVCTLRRSYEPNALLAAHPPRLSHPHKRLTFELACPPGARHAGELTVTRWAPEPLPEAARLAATAQAVLPGVFDYAGPSAGVWHVNFADPQLFVAYGSRLLAQDELQVVEHPALGAVREALIAEGDPATTEDDARTPTPVLVAGVERRCAFATAPDLDAGRVYGLYGNRFAQAPAEQIRAATRVLAPPTITNLIAIAAPSGGRDRYTRAQLETILVTALTGFAAAVAESRRAWPDAPVEVRTGFWGCGAFGGNRHAMTLLQLLAARLAGVARLTFYAFDRTGAAAYQTGARILDEVVAAGPPGEPLAALLDRVERQGFQWGESDGT
jgi:hypothetical protein